MATAMIGKTIRWPDWLEDIARQYEQMDDEQLLRSIRDRFDLTVENLAHMAVSIRVAELRGLEVSIPGNNMLPTLRRIAEGQLLPEAAQRFMGHTSVFRKVACLPLSEQRRIASDQPLRVVQITEDGVDVRMIRPSQMTPEQAHQVFASDHVRDDSEQRSYLERRWNRPRRAPAGPYVLDRKRGLVRITESPLELTRRQLLDILASLG